MKNKEVKRKTISVVQIILLILPLVLCILFFTISPIIHTFIKSLRYNPNPTDLTTYVIGTGNYNGILSDPNFKHAIINSTAVLLIGTSISMILALTFALIISSIMSAVTKRVILSIIYSQFFISGFAVGIAFTLFFGSKGLFFYLIGLDKYSFTSGNKRIPIWIYYVIYQIWRSLPFNLVLFAAAISRGELKYAKLMKCDNLSRIQKIKFVYANEISKVFFSILFTNFIFSSLMYPLAILERSFDLDLEKAHTLTSYTGKYLGLGNNPVLTYPRGYSAAFFSFAYLVSLLCLMQLIRPKTIKGIINLIKKINQKVKQRKAAHVIN
ncbi:Glycerol ABC transporter, permease component [Mycoplasmopsis agalactiae 14628]|uniref:Glycerol ABC transporter, permease component n=1 Tax=Mycoplasmopsis agalactiae 14628 TaxID=1110504 RepID=I5D5T0_MYCAA|nr:sugar ABC transporter permease [Mycoplasmopsis agalactiae]EIN15039.1 Glycerol ABC transporter, permease component [Mycoplasmopsis agalactiae 14628]